MTAKILVILGLISKAPIWFQVFFGILLSLILFYTLKMIFVGIYKMIKYMCTPVYKKEENNERK